MSEKKREWHIGTGKTRQITARVPWEIYNRMQRYCKRRGWGVTQMVVYLLNQIPDVDDTEEGGTGH